MKLRPEEIASVLKAQIENYQAEVEGEDVRFGVLLQDVGVEVNGFNPRFYGGARKLFNRE